MAYVSKSAKELKTSWPIEEGLTAKTQKQTGRTMNLVATDGSVVSRKERAGIK